MKETNEIKISKEVQDRLKIELLLQKEAKAKLKGIEDNILTIITTILYQNSETDYKLWELANDLSKMTKKPKTAEEIKRSMGL